MDVWMYSKTPVGHSLQPHKLHLLVHINEKNSLNNIEAVCCSKLCSDTWMIRHTLLVTSGYNTETSKIQRD